jgi:ABC-type branched-subunit amino acid transport system substrate-binding protein
VINKRLYSIIIPALLILLVTVIITSCSPQQTTPTPTAAATPTPGQTSTPTPTSSEVKEVIIGLVGAWSGAYGPGGKPQRDTTQAAAKMINEEGGFVVAGQRYTIKIIEYDDRTDSKRAVAGVTMLKDMYDINMLCGPFGSAMVLPAQPIIETRHILETNNAAAEEATRESIKWCWTYTAKTSWRALAFIPYLAQVMQVKTLGILTENEAFCLDQRVSMLAECAKQGIQIVSDQNYATGTTDFSTSIARARLANPDVMFVNGPSGSNIVIVRQIGESGWKVQIVGSNDLIGDDQFRTNGAAANELLAFSTFNYYAYKGGLVPENVRQMMGTDQDLLMKVVEYYGAQYGDQARLGSGLTGYRWISSFVECMKKAGTVDDAQKLRDTYEGMEWQDGMMLNKALSNHSVRTYIPVEIFYESKTGADKFKILGVSTPIDDTMTVWKSTVAQAYPTISEIRAKRGY